MSKSQLLGLVFSICLSTSAVVAQETCGAIVQTALDTAAENCDGLRRNEACYGNVTIDAEAAPDVDEFVFEDAGDIVQVSDIVSMRLSSDLGIGDWGISLLRLRASLEDSVADDVVMVLTGEVAITNQVDSTTLTVTANSNTRLRSEPSSANDFNVLAGINAGAQMTAFGRTESGEWLRVRFSNPRGNITQAGWIAAIVVDGDSERMTLPVVEVDQPFFGALQAFTLRTGETDASDCEEIPPDGLLIQTPEGVGQVEFLINEVSISLGSTVYVTITDENALRTYLLEGKTSVSAQGQRSFAPPGTYVEVPLSEDGSTYAGVPADPQPYETGVVAGLPVELLATWNEEPITIAEPVPEGQVDAAIAETYISNPHGVIDGWYRVSVISFEQVVPNRLSTGYCASGGTVLTTLHTEFSPGFTWDIINVESPTSFTFTGDSSDPSLGGCIVEHRATWVPRQPR